MNYKLKCRCGAICWVSGSEDPETNSLELNQNKIWEWEGGNENCNHDDYEIVDSEDIFDPEDFR